MTDKVVVVGDVDRNRLVEKCCDEDIISIYYGEVKVELPKVNMEQAWEKLSNMVNAFINSEKRENFGCR
jgi:hypothetical protein